MVEDIPVSRAHGLALWRQIEVKLTADIRNHVLRAGDRLPTEAELAVRFGVNRHTLRRAMAALQEAGLIRIEQGRGTFVQEPVVTYRVAKRTRFSENMAALDLTHSGRLLGSEIVYAEGDIAKHLVQRQGRRVLALDILRVVDERPYGITRHHFPLPRFDGMAERFRQTGSITQSLFQMGIKDYFRQQTRVYTRLPSAEDAEVLDQPRSQPVLVTESVNVDPEGRPLEYNVARYAGQRTQLVFEP